MQIGTTEKDKIFSAEDRKNDGPYLQIGQKDTFLDNLRISSNDLDTLYHIISENIEKPYIKSLFEQHLNTNESVNIVEQMFKIQIAMFCKKGSSSVNNEELRSKLTQIKQIISEKFASDLNASIDVISK